MKIFIKQGYTNNFDMVLLKSTKTLHNRYVSILKLFSNYKFTRILDVGCGDGSFSILLKEASHAQELYGIELCKENVEIANKRGVNVICLNINSEKFPFEDDFFDAVYAGEIIEHVFDPDSLLDEVHRVLKPNGFFLLTTPNIASLYNRIALIFGYQPFGMTVSLRYRIGHVFDNLTIYEKPLSIEESHIRVFSCRTLKQLLSLHGFSVQHVTGAFMELPNKKQYFSLLLIIKNVLDRATKFFPSLCYQIIVSCRKI